MEKLIQIVESAIGYFNYKQNKSVLQLLFWSLLHHAIHIVRKCLDTYFQYTDFFLMSIIKSQLFLTGIIKEKDRTLYLMHDSAI